MSSHFLFDLAAVHRADPGQAELFVSCHSSTAASSSSNIRSVRVRLLVCTCSTLLLKVSAMGSGSSSVSSEARDHAGWTHTPSCNCPNHNWRALKYSWKEVTLMDGGTEAAYWVGRTVWGVATLGLSEVVNGGIKNPTHDCVRMDVKCGRCKRVFVLTYGHFKTYRILRAEQLNSTLNYEQVYNAFDSMWDVYGVVNQNCGHWARDFFYKLQSLER
ncbi:hypothetical protein M3Y99_00601500 [Aphelenchoides fujianensis]|nr:hypothetical protein M3Y99_00601500 [Aphelenchoides fujianensis]